MTQNFRFFITCKCGCGEAILDRDHKWRLISYKKGHYDRKKIMSKMGKENWHLLQNPIIREKIRLKKIGVKRSKESCLKQSKTMMGHKISKETAMKISLAQKGIKTSEEEKQIRILNKINKYQKELPKYEKIIKMIMNDELINGVLLSDGGLLKPKSINGLSGLSVSQKTNNMDFLLKIQEHLNDLGFETKINTSFHKNQKTFFSALRTRKSIIWTELRKTWYPNDKKVIPEYLQLTPKTIGWWFMGDGSSSWRNKEKTNSRITLCTDCFSRNEVIRLQQQLSKFEIDSYIRFLKSNNSMGESQPRIVIDRIKSTDKFFKIVENYNLKIFNYKIKKPLIKKIQNSVRETKNEY